VTASAPVGDDDVTMLSGPAVAAPLPVALPIMPGAQVTGATHVSSPDGLRIALVEMVSDENPAAVAAFYRAAADEAGLTSAFDMGGGEAVTFIAIGEDRERVTVHAARARVTADGARVAVLDEDGKPIVPEEDDPAPAETRDATAIQLHMIGRDPGTPPPPAS